MGDEFQGIVKDLPTGIKIILALEEAIIRKKFDFKLRYILHQGEIETAINTQVAHGMLGNGLTEARTNLNNMKQKHRRFCVSSDNQLQQAILSDAFIVYQNITEKWDVNNDYQIASAFIQLKDYKEVARELNRTKSLMWKREKTLNMDAYFAIKQIILTISSQYFEFVEP